MSTGETNGRVDIADAAYAVMETGGGTTSDDKLPV